MNSKYFAYVAILAGVLSFLYWTAFGASALYNFHEYDDLGRFAYSMWVAIHYPSLVHGFQFIIFCTHIVPDLIAALPLYYIAPSALTLLSLQALILSAAGVSIFFVANDLLKRPLLALGMSLAFLINPGVFGMLVFDFHAESLIALFYILTFYFYMKMNRKAFFACSLLLLGIIEEAPFLGFSLGLALLLYDYRFNKDIDARKKKMMMALSLMVLSIVVFLLYTFITNSLESSYAQGQYIGLAPILQIAPTAQYAIATLSNPFSALGLEFGPFALDTIYGLTIAIFSFGIAILFDPLSALILLSPWLTEFLVAGNFNFVFVFDQYFGFVIGSTVVVTILAIKKIEDNKGTIVTNMLQSDKERAFVLNRLVPGSLIAISLLLFLLFPTFVYSKNVNNFAQDFLFQVSPQQHALVTQLYSVMDYLPANASVLSTYFVFPHIADRRNIELLYPTGYYFAPQYILLDFNLNVSLNAYSFGQPQYFTGFWANESKNYTIYAENGTGWVNSVVLLKRNASG